MRWVAAVILNSLFVVVYLMLDLSNRVAQSRDQVFALVSTNKLMFVFSQGDDFNEFVVVLQIDGHFDERQPLKIMK